VWQANVGARQVGDTVGGKNVAGTVCGRQSDACHVPIGVPWMVASRYLCVLNMAIGVSWMVASPMTYGAALTVADQFVASFTIKMQENISDIMDLEHLVVNKFVKVSFFS
jgi:hypothetical protein